MSSLIQIIDENECIGDSLAKINTNAENLDTAVQTLSTFVQGLSTSIVVTDSDTIDLTRTVVGGAIQLQADVKSQSITTSTIAPEAITTNTIANSAVTPAKLAQPLTLMNSKTFNWNGLTNNTFLDIEGIPSWANQITVMLSSVSLNGSALVRIQVGSGAIATTGYQSTGVGSGTGAVSTNGFDIVGFNTNTDFRTGQLTLTKMTTGNVYTGTGMFSQGFGAIGFVTGLVGLSGAIDRVRVTSNGSDTFDLGVINVMYQ